MWPHRKQPARLPHPWNSPGMNTGVACHFLLQCMKVKLLSVQLFVTPWTAAHQGPPSMGFCRQEYGSGLPLGIIGEYIFINLFLIQITQKIFMVLTLIKLADLLFCSLSTWNNSLINSCWNKYHRCCIQLFSSLTHPSLRHQWYFLETYFIITLSSSYL